ncbi:hypothetical protein B0J11DRAFT_296497 [Dendryphion nanum]|uniref:Uncharacterized protein n=1 Tax=Dendryphion nanum TaxID=256645 RepID=A0A9P9DVU4_9PLEO|nr:hypothetical protein B0J11DRAFT_296497 [Dendryphion nanum]
MAPRHGIKISPGVNFSALAQSPSSHIKRQLDTSNPVAIILIVVLVLTGIGLVFCVVVFFLIMKNKQVRRMRERKLEESRPLTQYQHQHAYAQIQDSNVGGAQELPSGFQSVELQGDVNHAPRGAQQLEGFAAPPRVNTHPVELPPDAHTNGVVR